MALMWNRTVDWDADDWRRPPHAATPNPTCSSRSARPARRSTRSRRPSGCATPARPRSPAWTSRWPPTKSRASGAAPPRRSGASCARPGWPPAARLRSLPALRLLQTHCGGERSASTACRGDGSLGPPPPSGLIGAGGRSGTGLPAALTGGAARHGDHDPRPPTRRLRHPLHGDAPVELAHHQVAHDGEAEAGRPLDVEPSGQADAVVLHPHRELGPLRPWSPRRGPTGGPDAPPAPPSPDASCWRRVSIEAVLDRVLEQLGHRHRQRRGHFGRHLAQVPRGGDTIGWTTPPSPRPS